MGVTLTTQAGYHIEEDRPTDWMFQLSLETSERSAGRFIQLIAVEPRQRVITYLMSSQFCEVYQ